MVFEDVLRIDNSSLEAKKNFNDMYVTLDQKIKKNKARKQPFDEKIILRFLNENLTHLLKFHKTFLHSGKMTPQNFIYLEDEKCVIFQPLNTVDSNYDETNFTAPETRDGLPSIHSDIYSLGCIVLYMCTGTLPKSAELYNKKIPNLPKPYSDDLNFLLTSML